MPETTSSESQNRITAVPGSPEYERQFRRQASDSIHAICGIPLVRAINGLLAFVYSLLVLVASFFVVRTQLSEGMQLEEIVTHSGCVIVMWYVISMHAGIAFHGQFERLRLFAPRQQESQ